MRKNETGVTDIVIRLLSLNRPFCDKNVGMQSHDRSNNFIYKGAFYISIKLLPWEGLKPPKDVIQSVNLGVLL